MNILKFLVSVIFLIYCFSSDLKAKNLEIEITKNLRCLICQGQSAVSYTHLTLPTKRIV